MQKRPSYTQPRCGNTTNCEAAQLCFERNAIAKTTNVKPLVPGKVEGSKVHHLGTMHICPKFFVNPSRRH